MSQSGCSVGDFEREWLVVRLGIVIRNLNVEVAHVTALIPFRDVHRFALRMTERIEPWSVVADRVYYERVLIPPPDGISAIG
jgi:hypothetical protein